MGIAINTVIIYYVTWARDTEVRYILENMLSQQLMHHKKTNIKNSIGFCFLVADQIFCKIWLIYYAGIR